MISTKYIRTTKFPYFFWSFNKAYKCNLDFSKGEYENLEKQTHYKFTMFNRYAFLSLKYVPIVIILLLCFSIYDFIPSKIMVASYILALFLTISVNLLDNMVRKVACGGIFALSILAGWLIGDYFLIAYVIKYFLFLSLILIFYLDYGLIPYSLIKDDKVLAHFLIKKEEDKNEK